MEDYTDKIKYPNIISINEIRKRKGLAPVEDYNSYIDNNDKDEEIFDKKIEEIDEDYNAYIMKAKTFADEGKRVVLFKEFLEKFNKFFDFIYEKEAKKSLDKSPLKEEINYAMTGAGKRLRPFLMYITYRAFGGEVTDELVNFMIAIELIHSFSLIHDDMPCMDNDELRRGKPSVWKKYGEARALLAGDAMVSLAQEIAGYTLLDSVLNQDRYTDDLEAELDEDGEVYLDEEDMGELRYNAHEAFVYTACIQILASATGAQGMVAGQADELDLQDKKDLKIDDILGMYSYKTGALLSACLTIGYEMSLFEDDLYPELDNMGRILGALYQIKDDLDDITLTTEELGKPTHSDEKNDKHTYIAIRGINGSKKDINMMTKLIYDKFDMFEKKNIEVVAFRDYIYFVLNKKG